MKRFFFAFAALLLALAAAACSGGEARPPDDGPGADATPDENSSPPATASAEPSNGPNPPPVTPGIVRGELFHDGRARTYRLFVPDSIEPGAGVPLVVGLHGGLGSGEQFAESTRFEIQAQQHRFIAVFPDGVGRTWNGGNCCGVAARNEIDDVGFLAALIEDLAARFPIDRGQVFMTGHSNGGIMAFRFGCERPDLVRAIASVAGSLEVPGCGATRGVDLLSIHGDSDQAHPLEGGHGPLSIAGVDFVSQARSLDLWTRAMACTVLTEPQSSGPTSVSTWSGCRDGVEAKLMVVRDADHPWPGGVDNRPAAADRTSNAIDATTVVTSFFLDR